ncbi:hypothetical protein DJ82_13315 [Halorubrum sp. Ib24]|nr:hypothetical protein DJ82_13315 [Halorubrum sp. Ib24]
MSAPTAVRIGRVERRDSPEGRARRDPLVERVGSTSSRSTAGRAPSIAIRAVDQGRLVSGVVPALRA